MVVVTAKPPVAILSTYIPSAETQAFRDCLAGIHATDERNGTQTPTTTFLWILRLAERLGVPQAELVGNDDAV